MNAEEEFKSKEKFVEFIQGKGFYVVLTIVILVPLGLHFLAYKKPMKSLFYLNLFIGLILIGYGIYVIAEYQSIVSIYEKISADALTFINMLPEEQRATAQAEIEKGKEKGKQELKELIGNRCMALGSISILIGLVSVGWNIKKLRE